jgi:AraC-like DNA-binding protein
VLCAICHKTNETMRLCAKHRADPANVDWVERTTESDTDDLDEAMAIAGASERLSTIVGGARKLDTETAAEVVRLQLYGTVKRLRRRRNENGHLLRGWEEREEPMSFQEIAKNAGCSESYVRKVLRRVRQ